MIIILPSCLKPNNNGNPHGIFTRPQQMSLIPWREYAFSPANFRIFFQPGASIMQISCTYEYHLMHPLAPSANSRFLRLPRRLCQQPWHSLTHTQPYASGDTNGHRSRVLSSLPAIHDSNCARSRGLKPTLNFFGSVVRLVFASLHSSESSIGLSCMARGGFISKAETNRTNAVYSSRLARWAPMHILDPAP